jgi:hypothetical protein
VKLGLRDVALGVYLAFFALFVIWFFSISGALYASSALYASYRVILRTEIALFFVSGLGSTLLAYRVYKDGRDIQELKKSRAHRSK